MNGNRIGPIAGLRRVTGELTKGNRPNRTLRHRNARVSRAFNLSGKRVLELGCAEGLHSLYMADSAREVFGVDHRASVIVRANANKEVVGATNVTFICGDVRDAALLSRLGHFDLVVAWGFLHRVTDLFSMLETFAPVTKAFSLEWRTPVLPLMSRFSLAYHSPAGEMLDPMNLKPPRTRNGKADDEERVLEKIEGDTGFWEPTPGAVRILLGRAGFPHARLLGYGEHLRSEGRTIVRHWGGHLIRKLTGRCRHQLPLARVHMLFERNPGFIEMKDPLGDEIRLPEWEQGFNLPSRSRRRSSRADSVCSKPITQQW